MNKKLLKVTAFINIILMSMTPVMSKEIATKETFMDKVKETDIYKSYREEILEEDLIESELDGLYRVTAMFRLSDVNGDERILMFSADENHKIVLADEIIYTEDGILIRDYILDRNITINNGSVNCNTSVCMESKSAPYTSSQCNSALGFVCDVGKWAGYYGRVGTYVCKAGVGIGCSWLTRSVCLRYENMPICVA